MNAYVFTKTGWNNWFRYDKQKLVINAIAASRRLTISRQLGMMGNRVIDKYLTLPFGNSVPFQPCENIHLLFTFLSNNTFRLELVCSQISSGGKRKLPPLILADDSFPEPEEDQPRRRQGRNGSWLASKAEAIGFTK